MEAVLSIADIIEIETASDKLHISENGTTFFTQFVIYCFVFKDTSYM